MGFTLKKSPDKSGHLIASIYRPCFVVGRLPGNNRPEVIIYLRVKNSPLESLQFAIQSSPTVVWVYRLRGLPRSTSSVFQAVSSLWHFSGILGHSRNLSRFFRRHRQNRCPALFFQRAQTLRASQPVRAWIFLTQH